MAYYELIGHTADLGINVWGNNLEELFLHSASAMYDLIADLKSIKPSLSVEIKAEAMDRDELLKNWLSELLYYFHTKDMLFSDFKIDNLTDKSITSTVKG